MKLVCRLAAVSLCIVGTAQAADSPVAAPPIESVDPYYNADEHRPDEFNNILDCGETLACGVGVCEDLRIIAGFEATFLKPRFDGNVAYTISASDDVSFQDSYPAEFGYDVELSPRAFAGLQFTDGVGLRTAWWQFDQDARSLTDQPPANGFGRIAPPDFGDIDISTSIPTDVFAASSALKAYAIDLELTKAGQFAAWRLAAGAGVRYASIAQRYLAETRDASNDLLGRIAFRHESEGVGPTFALGSTLPLTQSIDFYANGRASLLFGQATSQLTGGEDLDLSTPFTTTQRSGREDLLPIGDLQVGLRWNGGEMANTRATPFASLAMEGQYWSGVGNASSELGNLGFFGFAGAAGVNW
jgi:hypothetical protein